MARIRRSLVSVAGRRVEYLLAGEGPPLLLIHPSPANADYLRPLIARLSRLFTCIAPNSPGFGLSDPLPTERLHLRDLASALAEFMATLALPACIVFGTHTGAGIALELAAGHPERVSAILADGLAIFTPEEQQELLRSNYLAPLVLDPLGGHLTSTWTRFRDQFIWFPWYARDPIKHNECDLVPADTIHLWVSMFYQCAAHYRSVYGAAITYGLDACAAVAALQHPATFLAQRSDMLYPHLERLPALKRRQCIRRVETLDEWSQAVDEELARFGTYGSDAAWSLPALGSPSTEWFVDSKFGDVFVRSYGDVEAPLTLWLHDAPGYGGQIAPLAVRLADTCRVLVPDLPDCGNSDALADAFPSIEDYASAIAELLARVSRRPVVAIGSGCGASVALALAHHYPESVRAVVLDGLPALSSTEATWLSGPLAFPIEIREDGSHWYRTWLRLRDSLIWWPEFEHTCATYRRVPADFSAETLHEWTVEVLKHPREAHRLPQAAARYFWKDALCAITQPLLLASRPAVPYQRFEAAVRELRPDARVATSWHSPDRYAAELIEFILMGR